MSNIIREIFVEDHVQQVSTSIKETLRDLYLLRHARDFKFYMSQAQWRVKIFAFFKEARKGSWLRARVTYTPHN